MMSYSQFLIEFLDAFVTNITIGVLALAGGMLVGIPLAYLRRASGLGGRLAAVFVALLRASPVFVLMFLFVNVFGSTVTLSWLSDRDLTPALS